MSLESDIVLAVSNLLENNKTWQERADEFVIDSRRNGTHAVDNKLNDKVNEEEDDESIVDKARKEVEDEEEKSEKVETPDESPSTIDLSDASKYDKLVDILNQFRAAKSLSDEEVSVEMKKYFDKLTGEEKKVLYTLLKGLVQVTSQDVDGKAAYTPSDLKFTIAKGGSATSEKIKSIKRKQKSKEDAKKLDVSPIKIGDVVQEKKDIMRIIKENV